MSNFEVIETDEKNITVTSSNYNSYSYALDLRSEVTENYDIIFGMDFEYPENLDYIALEIGRAHV